MPERDPQVGDIYRRGNVFRHIADLRKNSQTGKVYGFSVRQYRMVPSNGILLVWPTFGQMKKWAAKAVLVPEANPPA